MAGNELFIGKNLSSVFAGKDAFKFINSLEGEVFRALESRHTFAAELDGKRYFIKHHRGTGVGEVVKNLLQFRLPVVSAHNEWRALSRLQELGVSVPHIAAYGKRGLLPQTSESFIVTKDVGTQENLEDLTRGWPDRPPAFTLKLSLIREVANIARTMHSHGICHRDFYICHFLMKGLSGRSGNRLTLIDLHRALVKKNLGQRWAIKDVGSLYFSAMDIGLTKRDLLRFIRFYSGSGLKLALKGNRSFWEQVASRGRRLKSRHS